MSSSSDTIHDTPAAAPDPERELVPSQQTPRTAALRERAQRLGDHLRRYGAAVAAFAGALGLTLPVLLQGSAAVVTWAREAGLWPPLAAAALGLLYVQGVRARVALREAMDAIERRATRQLDAYERILERQADTFQEAIERLMEGHAGQAKAIEGLTTEVRELRQRLDEQTGPRPRGRPTPPAGRGGGDA